VTGVDLPGGPAVPGDHGPAVAAPSDPGRSPASTGRDTAGRVGALVPFRILAVGFGLLIALTAIGGAAFAAANLLVRTTETDTIEIAGPVERVVVDVHGSVTIEPGAEDGTVIRRSSTFGLRRPRVRTVLEDGVLVVRVRCVGTVLCTNDVHIEVPRAAGATVHASEVRVRGLSGDVRAESQGGSIRLHDLSGDVVAEVGGGEVSGDGLRSPSVRATVGAGAIDLTFAAAPESIEADVTAGAIVIELPVTEATYRIEVSATSGESRSSVESDPDSPRLVRAHAATGDVEVRPTP